MMMKADWEKGQGLLPAVIQAQDSGLVLMLGYLNQDSLRLSLETGEVHFYSRSKKRIWKKGETSGNILKVVSIDLDCDNDSFLIKVIPRGQTCHTGKTSCFSQFEDRVDLNFLSELEMTIKNRWETHAPGSQSYVASLRDRGLARIAQKVGEEAVETVIASLRLETDEDFKSEAADLIFHLLVLMQAKGSSLSQILSILKKRRPEKENL